MGNIDLVVPANTHGAAQTCAGCWHEVRNKCYGWKPEPRLYFCSRACVEKWQKRKEREALPPDGAFTKFFKKLFRRKEA